MDDRLMLIAVGLLLLIAGCGSTIPSSSQLPEQTSYAVLNKYYSSPEDFDYRMFLRTTPPPPGQGLKPIPEFSEASFLVLVYNGDIPLEEILINSIEFIPIMILVPSNASLEEALQIVQSSGLQEHLRANRIRILLQDTDGCWIRDYGPIYVARENGTAVAVDMLYNTSRPGFEYRPTDEFIPYFLGAEMNVPTYRAPLFLSGGNFATDGKGLCFTSTETLYENGGNRESIDAILRDYCGCDEVVYLEPLIGPTTKHIDMFFRVVDAQNFILGSYEARPYPENAGSYFQSEISQRMERNYTLLSDVVKRRGQKVNIHRIRMPHILQETDMTPDEFLNQMEWESNFSGDSLQISRVQALKEMQREHPWKFNALIMEYLSQFTYPSYLNYVHVHHDSKDLLLVPEYSSADAFRSVNKKDFSAVLKSVYPNAVIHFIPCDTLIKGQGALHCISLVIPESAASDYRNKLRATSPIVEPAGDAIPLARFQDGFTLPIEAGIDEFRIIQAYYTITSGADAAADNVKNDIWIKAVERVVHRHAIEKSLKDLKQALDPADVTYHARTLAGSYWENPALQKYYEHTAYNELGLNIIMAEIVSPPTITDEDIRNYYTEHEDDYNRSSSATFAYVFFGPDSTASAVADTSTATDWFSSCLEEHICGEEIFCDDAGIKGWVLYDSGTFTEFKDDYWGIIPQERQDEVFINGQLDEIISLEDDIYAGLVLLKICDLTEGFERSFDEVKWEIKQELETQKAQRAHDEALANILRGVRVFPTSAP